MKGVFSRAQWILYFVLLFPLWFPVLVSTFFYVNFPLQRAPLNLVAKMTADSSGCPSQPMTSSYVASSSSLGVFTREMVIMMVCCWAVGGFNREMRCRCLWAWGLLTLSCVRYFWAEESPQGPSSCH